MVCSLLPKNEGTNLFCLLFYSSRQTNQIGPFIFWEKLADHKLLSRLTDHQLFTVSPSRLQEHHGSYSFFNYKNAESKRHNEIPCDLECCNQDFDPVFPNMQKSLDQQIVAQDSRLGADGFQFCRESISSQQYVAVQLHSRNFLLVHLLCQSSLLLSPFNMPS